MDLWGNSFWGNGIWGKWHLGEMIALWALTTNAMLPGFWLLTPPRSLDTVKSIPGTDNNSMGKNKSFSGLIDTFRPRKNNKKVRRSREKGRSRTVKKMKTEENVSFMFLIDRYLFFKSDKNIICMTPTEQDGWSNYSAHTLRDRL